MPGFVVNTIGGMDSPNNINQSHNRKYYYTYTWMIRQLFIDKFGDDLNELSPDSPLINVRDLSLPTFSFDRKEIKGSSLKYKIAESITWNDINITWYDTVGMLNVMRQWRQRIWCSNTGIKHPSSYKKDSKIEIYLPDGTSNQQWMLKNSWPSSISHGELTYTSSEIKVIKISLSYDFAYENEPDNCPNTIYSGNQSVQQFR